MYKWFIVLLLLLATVFSNAQSQEEDLADWFYQQVTLDAQILEELNNLATETYQQITGSDSVYSFYSTASRNEFYLYWPDYQVRQQSLYHFADRDLSCVVGSSYKDYNVQVFYLEYFDPYFVSTIFHENLHTDIYQRSAVDTSFLPSDTISWGFELRLNGEWRVLWYFDEAFVDYLKVKIMYQAGFTHFDDYAISYAPGVQIIEPFLDRAIENGLTIQQLWSIHSSSDVAAIFDILGREILLSRNEVYDRDRALLEGYQLAHAVNDAIAQSNPSSPNHLSTDSSCDMVLRFTPTQMERFNQQHRLSPEEQEGVWFQMDIYFFEPSSWYILSDTYYEVLSR